MIATLLASGHGFEFTKQGYYIIDFLVYAAILVVVLRKPISAFVALRREKLVKDIEEARVLRLAAETKLADYERRLAALEGDARKILADARAAGESDRARILAEATAAASKIKADAIAYLQQESLKLEHELRLHAVELASQVAEKLVTERITDNHRRTMFNDYVANLESRPGGIQ
jgi:F-type H+-transporting ATPase subunit b